MKRFVPHIVLALIAGLSCASWSADDKSLAAAKAQKYPPLPENVERRAVTTWGDGTKMAGDLYLPKNLKPEDKLPAVVFIAGTGGTKKGSAARMGPLFVNAGYIFLTFDYRGWGESDSKLLMLEPMPEPDAKGEVTVKARTLRWQMDFADQIAEIRSAIAFVAGEPNVDAQDWNAGAISLRDRPLYQVPRLLCSERFQSGKGKPVRLRFYCGVRAIVPACEAPRKRPAPILVFW